MKMMIGSILATFVIVFSFQNCQKAPYADEVVPTNKTSVSKVDLKGEKLSQINFLIQEKETIPRGGSSYDLIVNKTLQIDLVTGAFEVISDMGGVPLESCLTEDLKNELVSILKSSQICKTTKESSGQACTMALKVPYAQIVAEGAQYDLGSASDGCETNKLDLCGDQPQILQGYIAALKNNYKTLSCTQ